MADFWDFELIGSPPSPSEPLGQLRKAVAEFNEHFDRRGITARLENYGQASSSGYVTDRGITFSNQVFTRYVLWIDAERIAYRFAALVVDIATTSFPAILYGDSLATGQEVHNVADFAHMVKQLLRRESVNSTIQWMAGMLAHAG